MSRVAEALRALVAHIDDVAPDDMFELIDTATWNEATSALAEHDAQPVREPAHWYSLSREGIATLCADERDARQVAADSELSWPAGRPHRAVQLAPASPAPDRAPLTAEQVASIVREASQGSAIRRDGTTSLRIVRAVERAHGIGR
jgi:hypothetical protein